MKIALAIIAITIAVQVSARIVDQLAEHHTGTNYNEMVERFYSE